MSFILKSIRDLITTTTTTVAPTTTTTTTTTTLFEQNIADENVSVGGFGSTGINYGVSSPVFAEFSKTVGVGSVGDIEMVVLTNNTILVNNGDGTYDLNVDITVRFGNTINAVRLVDLPRVAIDLPMSTLVGTVGSFIPAFGATSFRVYSPSRVVCEFNKLTLQANGSADLSMNGTVVLNTVGAAPTQLVMNIGTVGLVNIGIEVQRNGNTGILAVSTFDAHGDTAETSNTNIPNGATSLVHQFTPNFVFVNGFVGSVIRVVDLDTPHYIVSDSQTIGYDEAPVLAAAPTTTTTTTAAPSARLRFVDSNGIPPFKPNPPNESTVNSGEILTYQIEVVTTSFNPIPYRVEVASSNANVGLVAPIGNVGGDSVTFFVNGTTIQDTTITFGNETTVVAEFLNSTSIGGQAFFLNLMVDNTNNGNYTLQDSIAYVVNPDQV